MRRDFLIAIILGLATIPFGLAMMVAPEYLHLRGIALAVTFWGGAALSLALIVIAVVVALRGDANSPPAGHRRRMLAIIGMAVFGFGFMACAVWFYLERPTAQVAEAEPAKDGSKRALGTASMPSLFSLFMSDFTRRDGVVWNAVADLELSNNEKHENIRIFYNIMSDPSANSKFLAFYVPRTSFHLDVMSFIASNYAGYIKDIETNHWAVMGNQGTAGSTNTRELPFSGRIYIYHEDDLTVEEAGDISKKFREHGASVLFRGTEHALAVWQSIRSGDIKAPTEY